MKFRFTTGIHTLLASMAIASVGVMTACSDDRPEGGENPDNPSGISPEEAYTRAFIKKFGVFKGENWNEAVPTAVTLNSPYSMPISVYADIDGERYVFARVTAPKGKYSVPVNIPSFVTELIIKTEDGEYRMKPGTLLDLTSAQSRTIPTVNYKNITTLTNITWGYEPDIKPVIELDKERLVNQFLNLNGNANYFKIEDSKNNFESRVENDANFYLNSRFKSDSGATDVHFTIFPLFWKTNRYGESDYMLGYYVYHMDFMKVVEMHDLEDVDIKKGITFKQDSGEFSVVTNNGSSRAYDYNNLASDMILRSEGIHVATKGTNSRFCAGFYIKSGILDGSTPGKGRNCKHISFQNFTPNSMEWQQNYWDVEFGNLPRGAYAGAVFATQTVPKNNIPTIIENPNSVLDINTNPFQVWSILGFSSCPDSPYDNNSPDFSDVVFIVKPGSKISTGKHQFQWGTTEQAFPWYLAAEDLGATDDFDFNDLIVNIYDVTSDLTRPLSQATNARYPAPDILARRIMVVPRAAGGIYPIYLMYEGEVSQFPTDDCMASAINASFENGTFVIGTELHAWLGEPDYKNMLNTSDRNETHFGRGVTFCVPISKDNSFDPKKGPYEKLEDNGTLRGFWVLVDKNDAMRSQLENTALDPTPLHNPTANKINYDQVECKNAYKRFSGRLGQGAYRVDHVENNPELSAPQMLMCCYTWYWCLERHSIEKAYPWFADWVNGDQQYWHPLYNSPVNPPYIEDHIMQNSFPRFWL